MGSSTPKPKLLEIPGAEGISVDYFKDLMGKTAPQLEVGAAQQIPLQKIASMGINEQTVQGLLGQYLGTSATDNEGYQLGMEEIKKTLGGEFYDPKTSDFWKGYRETSEMEQEQGVADLRRLGQLGGGLFSTGVAREEAGYVKGMGAERTMQLGGLYEKERDRKTNAVGQALGYAGFEEQGKTSRIGLGATVGAIPREIENQKNLAGYTQALGQSTADYSQQQQGYQAKYASELNTLLTQTGAAEKLMPQWSVPQGGGQSPLGGILGLVGTLAGIGK